MKGQNSIDKDHILDSRDICDRISYLEDEMQTHDDLVLAFSAARIAKHSCPADADDDTLDALQDALDEAHKARANSGWPDSDEAKELAELLALQEQAEGYCEDWRHGATLIRDDHFRDYAEELASDISDYDPRKVQWPFTFIDWDAAAEALQQDYTAVEFGDTTYWVR